jgi:hypothetical protein
LIRGCAEKQATRIASYEERMGFKTRRQVAADSTASKWPSMALGEGCGAVKPVTVTNGGNVDSRESRHPWVIDGVLFGFIRRIEIDWLSKRPFTVGSVSLVTDWSMFHRTYRNNVEFLDALMYTYHECTGLDRVHSQ